MTAKAKVRTFRITFMSTPCRYGPQAAIASEPPPLLRPYCRLNTI
jgi:hypothetical protein